jgi:signal transduction histidine kinase
MFKRAIAEMEKSILDALTAHIALLDSDGVILVVNAAWRRFAATNASTSDNFFVGQNYLATCDNSSGECSAEASVVAQGIRSVLSGEIDNFSIEYPCHSVDEKRWFKLVVTPLTSNPDSGVVVMHVNVTDRVLAEEALSAREFHQRLLAHSLAEETRRLHESQAVANVGSWETDLVSLKVKWSDETYRIFSLAPEELVPTHAAFMQCVHPDDRASVNDAFFSSLTKEGHFSIEHRIIVPPDLIKEIEERWYVYRDSEGRAVRAVGTCQDITARKMGERAILLLNSQLEDRVRERTQQLEAANKELDAFSYSVAHDLRSPLSVINGFSQLLLKADGAQLSEKGLHYVNRIRAGSVNMGVLIDGLLSIVKISGDTLRRKSVDITAMSLKVIQELRDSEPTRLVAIDVQGGLAVNGDPQMMAVVMQNLIANAWKYSSKEPHSYIGIGSELCEDGETCLFVRDNGVGFDMAYADKLFHRFQRLHKDTEFTGTGIGLANVKRVVERHGGQLWAESSPGHGATFRFTVNPATRNTDDDSTPR